MENSRPPLVLLVDGRVVAPLEVAEDRRARRRGLLGRDTIDGALLLRPARSVHTFAMTFPIDIATCTSDLEVGWVTTLGPGRLTRPRWSQHVVVEARAGSFERWGLRRGCVLGVAEDGDAVPLSSAR